MKRVLGAAKTLGGGNNQVCDGKGVFSPPRQYIYLENAIFL